MIQPPLFYWTGQPENVYMVEEVQSAQEPLYAMPIYEKEESFSGVPEIERKYYEDYFSNDVAQKHYESAKDNEYGAQNIVDRINSALSIWTTPEGQKLLIELQKLSNVSVGDQIYNSLRTTWYDLTKQDLDFKMANVINVQPLPLTALDWAATQLEWMQWEAIQIYWSGDRPAGRYALSAKSILGAFRNDLIRRIEQTPMLPGTGMPGDIIPIGPKPPAPPAPSTSNQKILLIGASVVALLYFLSKRK